MLKITLMVVIAYLLGSIPSGLWIGQHFYNKDIRQLGSGNIGTTNTYRVLGPKAGTVVLVMDILKGTLAASQPYLFHSNMHDYILATVAGILTAVVIYRHRSNINRIIHGQESMVSFGLGHYLKNRK